jgi:pimeloyl-ACP methyl ester carboxylesterase
VAESAGRNGVELAYEIAGRGDPAMVFVHGWSCDRSYFLPQFEFFARRHRVATVDLRGHGESGRPQPGPSAYVVETFAQDVLAVAEAAGLVRPIVVGHSLGALVALQCAAGDSVRAAVLIDSAPIVNTDVKQFLARGADLIEHGDDAWRTNLAKGWFLPTDTVRREDIIQAVAAFPSDVAAASLRAVAEFDGVSALHDVDVPLLSIGSAVPTDSPADLRAACPTITIGQTVGSGHFNHLEVPDQVNLMIGRFLAINGLEPVSSP